jgi:hypothetical protein
MLKQANLPVGLEEASRGPSVRAGQSGQALHEDLALTGGRRTEEAASLQLEDDAFAVGG